MFLDEFFSIWMKVYVTNSRPACWFATQHGRAGIAEHSGNQCACEAGPLPRGSKGV